MSRKTSPRETARKGKSKWSQVQQTDVFGIVRIRYEGKHVVVRSRHLQAHLGDVRLQRCHIQQQLMLHLVLIRFFHPFPTFWKRVANAVLRQHLLHARNLRINSRAESDCFQNVLDVHVEESAHLGYELCVMCIAQFDVLFPLRVAIEIIREEVLILLVEPFEGI